MPTYRQLLCIFVFLSFTATSRAQLTEATLKGIVTDSSDGAVGKCEIALSNDATGQVRTSATDNSGAFVMAGLPRERTRSKQRERASEAWNKGR